MGKVLRIAVGCEDNMGINGQVSPHFGRSPFYTVVEVKNGTVGDVKSHINPCLEGDRPGTAPEFVKLLGADVVLAGGMGRRAVLELEKLGVEAATGEGRIVSNIVGAYLRGRLRGAAPCEHNRTESCGGWGHGNGAGRFFDD